METEELCWRRWRWWRWWRRECWKAMEVVKKSWRVGRGWGVGTEAVREGLWRRERREEAAEASNMMEREAVAGWWRDLVAELLVSLVRLVREPWLGV